MSQTFQTFIANSKEKISAISDWLKEFEIDAKRIGVKNAKLRIISWLENFDKIGFREYNLPLLLIEKISFVPLDEMADRLIKNAADLIPDESAYITHLGEVNESSFNITSKLNRHPRYFLSLPDLLNDVPFDRPFKIILFDDSLNSGGQVTSIFYALIGERLPEGKINDEFESRHKLLPDQVKKLRYATIHIFYYQVFEDAARTVGSELKSRLNLDVIIHSHHFTTANDSVFGDSQDQECIEEGSVGIIGSRSIFQGYTYKELMPFYFTLKTVGESLLRENELTWSDGEILKRTMGYGNLSRLVVYYNNIPTVSLTALWQPGNIKINGKDIFWTELVPRTKKVLKRKQPVLDEENAVDWTAITNELQTLYENDQIAEGQKVSEKYFEKYGSNELLLKHVLRFNMRDKNWTRINEIVGSLNFSLLNDNEKATVRFLMFECKLREAFEFRSNADKFSNSIKDIRSHLNQVPGAHRESGLYYYYLGRWYLELWWSYRETNNVSSLRSALTNFDNSFKVENRLWTQCYRCMVLKLLHNNNALAEGINFRTRIIEFQKKRPAQTSIRNFCITSHILCDDLKSLEEFLANIKMKVLPTDFEDSLIHRIEVIYWNDPEKQQQYKDIIIDWCQQLHLQ